MVAKLLKRLGHPQDLGPIFSVGMHQGLRVLCR